MYVLIRLGVCHVVIIIGAASTAELITFMLEWDVWCVRHRAPQVVDVVVVVTEKKLRRFTVITIGTKLHAPTYITVVMKLNPTSISISLEIKKIIMPIIIVYYED